MSQKTIHLICNAHLDPVWLWQREEGIAEALSTFRIAADFCDEYDNFVFCHNEAIIYQWVEEFSPDLFRRIQSLVKKGRWNIIGGWYLQPDCNMLSGESVIRQINLGKKFFQEKFGVHCETAVNFDPFGHSRGLVQILKKTGYNNYLFMRPNPERCSLPDDLFRWIGYDGSEIVGHRLFQCYLTRKGKAREKLEEFVKTQTRYSIGMVTWGMGNHGGGASRIDLEAINNYIKEHPEYNIIHSNPDKFFSDLIRSGVKLPSYNRELNFFATGCYTSQIRIKQMHRRLEGELNLTEKMASAACLAAQINYPEEKLLEAAMDLAFVEFHDVLPGSGIKAVEEDALQQIAHGREILAKIRTKAFISMLSGREKAANGNIPVFVWNPHPYKVKKIIECEVQLAEPRHDTYIDISVYDGSKKLVSQIEHEASNLSFEWRKKVAFAVELPPCSIKRFEFVPEESVHVNHADNVVISQKHITIDNGTMKLVINRYTGLLDSYSIDGVEYIRPGAGKVMVMKDNADSWETVARKFRKKTGSFTRMSRNDVADLTGGYTKNIAAVRIIESGPVRTVVEALFKYKKSTLRTHYLVPGTGSEVELRMQMLNREPNCMFKLSIPFTDKDSTCSLQDIFGIKDVASSGEEKVFNQWCAVSSSDKQKALGIICDSGHGMDFMNGEIRYSLLRSPCYSSLPIFDKPLVTEDRVHDHIDIGEREFKIVIDAGNSDKLLANLDRKAMIFNEPVQKMVFFPDGQGQSRASSNFMHIYDSRVVLTSCRISGNKEMLVRLYNPTGATIKTSLKIFEGAVNCNLKLMPFEVKTLSVDIYGKNVSELDYIT